MNFKMISIKLLLVTVCIYLGTVDAEFHFNCDTDPCQHGECIDLYRKTAYRCECEPGWDGENCDKSLGGGSNDDNSNIGLPDTNNDIIEKLDHGVNDNNDNDLIGSDSDNVQNNNNPCGGECKNNGYCDEEKHRCECTSRFTGEFCQYSSLHGDNVYRNIGECEAKCKDKEIKSGSTCDYKQFGMQETCKCGIAKINKDGGFCLPVFNTFKDCQNDCRYNTDFARNETRICNYFNAENKPLTCGCEDKESEWCSEVAMIESAETLLSVSNLGSIAFVILLGILWCAYKLFCTGSKTAEVIGDTIENIALNTQNQEEHVSVESLNE